MPERAQPPGAGSSREQSSSLLPPDHFNDFDSSTAGSSSDLVHLSREASRQPSPFVDLSHPSTFESGLGKGRTRQEEEESEFEDWGDDDGLASSLDDPSMPSDLRSPSSRSASHQHHPLLAGDKHQDYVSPNGPQLTTRRSARFRERENDMAVKDDTKKRYTYAAAFLLLSLVSFAVQTETAVYIQHDLNWKKPFCMLYFTHGSWTLLWFVQLFILRIQKWNQPWDAFWRRHISLLRSTAQMIEHQTLHIPPQYQKKSPVPYFVRITVLVTCALTLGGVSWYIAVDLTTASDLTAIYNCSAFFAYAFAVPLLGEKLKFSKAVAVGVAILGVLVVAYGDQGTAKHGNKSGGGTGGPSAPDDSEASNRTVGNVVIGIGSVLYGFYEVLYKRVACPPEKCSPGRGMLFANAFGSMMGIFTLTVLWIPLVIFHITGIEKFELPHGEAAWVLLISVTANAIFSGSFLVLISLTSPVLSSVAALLTIFLVALCDQMLPPPFYHPLTGAAIAGGVLIIAAFSLLSWATYREMVEERAKKPEERVEESESEDIEDR